MLIFECQTSHIVHIRSTYQNSGLPVLNTKIKQNTCKTYENHLTAGSCIVIGICFERRTYILLVILYDSYILVVSWSYAI